MLFSELMKVCGDPTFAQRGSADDPNLLLVEKAVSSINNRRAKWLRVRAKAKARGTSQHAHTHTSQAKPRPRYALPHTPLPCNAPLPPKKQWPYPAAGETGWIDPEPEPRGPKRDKRMPTVYQVLGVDEWPIAEQTKEADEPPNSPPAGPPGRAGERAAP